ncbi:hypothetical protein CHCC20375_2713 [Bacillus licheniformis]|uniref:hypothetical protein n=1 Tax=Bacillus TaxID=1386 RepID=UPI00130D1591|nr:hypothetical protein [Bacillus haynesii]TWK14055.1 hypothetical protein CHCC20375_2713 [Bacillus licheniformis]MCY7799913.1 hypothetical protein [Bacillus haynesii]MCY8542365.1 hypothetical protein [Bacillus haynesii]MEC1357397.1 hypothetical protein [Bacillus haynesii]MEC1453142.1 hypothetical protein [Bacillus haynesii]
MFFKDADPKGKKAADGACRAAFIFWAVILFVNTTFEYFDREPLISNFSFLLGLGLAVFFLTERLVKWLAVAKTRKTLR